MDKHISRTLKFAKHVLDEFKKFISKGNVIDLAVAVVMGAAFTNIITALVKDVITPILGIFLGGINFNCLAIEVGHAHICYGSFLQAVINFLIIGFVIFILVKMINKIEENILHNQKEKPKVSPELKELQEIKHILKSMSKHE